MRTIVKPKEKLKIASAVVQDVKVKQTIDFPQRPRANLPALKRKQKKSKRHAIAPGNAEPSSPSAKVHQKKHVKLAEKKKKLAQKFELMLKDDREAKRVKKVERINKKIGSVATMGAIKDALPSLDSLLKFKGTDIKTGIPQYDSIPIKGAKKTNKKRDSRRKDDNKFALKEKRISKQSQDQVKRYEYLQKLMSDDTFRKNPRQVIAEHIKNTKLEEQNQ